MDELTIAQLEQALEILLTRFGEMRTLSEVRSLISLPADVITQLSEDNGVSVFNIRNVSSGNMKLPMDVRVSSPNLTKSYDVQIEGSTEHHQAERNIPLAGHYGKTEIYCDDTVWQTIDLGPAPTLLYSRFLSEDGKFHILRISSASNMNGPSQVSIDHDGFHWMYPSIHLKKDEFVDILINPNFLNWAKPFEINIEGFPTQTFPGISKVQVIKVGWKSCEFTSKPALEIHLRCKKGFNGKQLIQIRQKSSEVTKLEVEFTNGFAKLMIPICQLKYKLGEVSPIDLFVEGMFMVTRRIPPMSVAKKYLLPEQLIANVQLVYCQNNGEKISLKVMNLSAYPMTKVERFQVVDSQGKILATKFDRLDEGRDLDLTFATSEVDGVEDITLFLGDEEITTIKMPIPVS